VNMNTMQELPRSSEGAQPEEWLETPPPRVEAMPSTSPSHIDQNAKIADRPHHWTVSLSVAALLVSLASAGVSMYSARFARLQYQLALDVRADARKAAEKQTADVGRTRKAAEDSAAAAKILADANLKGLTITERSARAAETSATAGRESLAISKRALLLSGQPVLETLNTRLLKPLASGEIPVVQTLTVNTGKGPAFSIDVTQQAMLATTFSFPWTARRPSHHDVLGPVTPSGIRSNIESASQFDGAFTAAEVDAVQQKKAYLFVYGLVQYEQRITETPEKHSYTFCYFYVPGFDATSTNSFRQCPQQPTPPPPQP